MQIIYWHGSLIKFLKLDSHLEVKKHESENLGRWDVIKGKNPLNNFDRQRKAIMKEAGISDMSFHDLRRTCLTNWFKGGLREFDVMRMAGHSSFETTRKFYMGIDRDLLERTRQVNATILEPLFVTHLSRAPKNA